MTNSSAPTSSNRGFVLGVVAIVIVGFLVVALLATSGGDGSDGESTATVEIVGAALSSMPANLTISDATNDPAAGSAAPTLTGTSFNGDEVVIEADGRPKVVYFIAHWCPHCQDEIPVIQELLDEGVAPDGLDIYAVSTGVDASRGNYPPGVWLDREGFEPIVIRDDESHSAFNAFGGSAFPYVVYLDADNNVVARSAGSLDKATIAALWDTTASA